MLRTINNLYFDLSDEPKNHTGVKLKTDPLASGVLLCPTFPLTCGILCYTHTHTHNEDFET
ncbi:unnamed protein product [Amoebophrya sp. A25]|nr:unnamed protein product [Amoebophrya sp. A25]|eukprot:GSA25T00026402001.1